MIWFRPILAVLLVFLVTACAQEPYIYKEDEFNRAEANFAKDPIDRKDVRICYNRRSTTPQTILKMAADECGRYGKRAVFSRHDYLECPVSVPARAIFLCEKP